ncbi:MAG: BTAD domain-containing putative transcriptional regulator [Caldilineaceae bacterium]
MHRLKLRLLGSPSVRLDDREIDLRERKATALLAYLALEPTRPQRDTLAALLWPDHDQKRARANLRYLLWSLRKELGEEWLSADAEQISLGAAAAIEGDLVDVDVLTFRRLVEEWRAHKHSEDEVCPTCRARLEEAVALYRGDFLQGFSLSDSSQFDDWQFFHAEALRRDMSTVLAALVAQLTRAQAYEAALSAAQRWYALDSLHEPAVTALMKLFYWSGRYEAANRQFHQYALTLQDEIGATPSPQIQDLYAQIRNRQLPAPSQSPSTRTADETAAAVVSASTGNLPPTSTPLIGRAAELAQIAALLADPSVRLLTVLGPGGIGKSTLALSAGSAATSHFADGVWFVPLADLGSPEEVPSRVLSILGIPTDSGLSPAEQLQNHLRSRNCLLILDNFEDVLPAASMAATLLKTCPQVKIVTTTRERLHLHDEHLLPLDSLTYPPTAAKTEPQGDVEYSAVTLFVACAQRLQPGFTLTDELMPSVVQICQLVDGVPLALEMAAAWVRVLPPDAIAAEIERSLSILAMQASDVAPRHRSIQAVFEHSWQLLSEEERSIVRQLSIFRSGFSRQAAMTVAGASLWDLSALLDKSWIHMGDSDRYTMHRLARQYALARLQHEHELLTEEPVAEVYRRHCHYFADLSSELSVFDDDTPPIPPAEADTIQLAWRTALSHEDWAALARIAVGLDFIMETWWHPQMLPLLQASIDRLQAHVKSTVVADAEQRTEDVIGLARLLGVAGKFHTHLGNKEESIVVLSQAKEMMRPVWRSDEESRLLYAVITAELGFALYYDGQFERAAGILFEILPYYEEMGMASAICSLHIHLALIHDRLGEYRKALDFEYADSERIEGMGRLVYTRQRVIGRVLTKLGRYQEAVDILCASLAGTAYRYRSHTWLSLGAAWRGADNLEESQIALNNGLEIALETGDLPALADLHLERGFTHLRADDLDTAMQQFEEGHRIAQRIGRKRNLPIALSGLAQVALRRGQIEDAQQRLIHALQAAQAVNAPPDILEVLATVAAFYAETGDTDAARDLLAVVERHRATTHEIREQARRLSSHLGIAPSPPTDTVLAANTLQILTADCIADLSTIT